MRLKRFEKKPPGIDMTPITDVVLQLLTFFMLTSTFIRASAINVDLPASKTSDIQPVREVTITLYKNGETAINSEPVTADNLGIKIKDYYIKDNSIVVTIQGDKGVPYGKLIETMDIVRLTGVKKLSLATVEEK